MEKDKRASVSKHSAQESNWT